MSLRPRPVLALAVVTLLAALARLASSAGEPVSQGAPSPVDHPPVPIRIVDVPLPDSLTGRCAPGSLRLRLRIDQRGLVTEARLSRPFPDSLCLDAAVARVIEERAIRFMRAWAFLPAVTGGMPQSMMVEMSVYVPSDTLRVPWHEGAVVGRVVDRRTGVPIPRAHVALDGSPLTTRTDREGWFVFDHLVRMKVAVIAEGRKYLPDTVVTDVAPGRTDTLRLRLPFNPAWQADTSQADP